jgi:hypothetical protein
MKEKDLNKIAKIEKAIKDKYGEEAIQNPKRHWDEEKEKKYLEDLKTFYKPTQSNKEKKEEEGYLVSRKKNLPDHDRNCPVCESYSFSGQDDLYMVKFDCCFTCYIEYVEDREERWKSGWRPNN